MIKGGISVMETGNTYNIWKCMIEEIKRNYNIKQVDLANIIGVEQSTMFMFEFAI